MGFLPDFDENGRLKPESKPKVLPTTGKTKSFLNWNNVLVARCPKCDNYLESRGEMMVCTSKSNGQKDCFFSISQFRLRDLKMDIGYRENQ